MTRVEDLGIHTVDEGVSIQIEETRDLRWLRRELRALLGDDVPPSTLTSRIKSAFSPGGDLEEYKECGIPLSRAGEWLNKQRPVGRYRKEMRP
jgi:hypothetical protein